MFRSITRLSFSVAVLAATTLPVKALTIGLNTGNDCTFLCTNTYQQVYAASNFSGPINITSVSFIVGGGGTLTTTGTWQMTLSDSAFAVNSLSTTFASNIGANAMVFDTETFSGTHSTGSLLTFSGNYNYDPASGPLLVTLKLTAGTNDVAGFLLGMESGIDSGVYGRAYAFSSFTTADAANNPNSFGDVTTFNVVPISTVPLPAALPLFATGLGALGGLLGWRRKRKAIAA